MEKPGFKRSKNRTQVLPWPVRLKYFMYKN